MNEEGTFFRRLRDEIDATVKSRTEIAREKIKFTYTLMGIGSVTSLLDPRFAGLLYVVPLVAVVFDLVYYRQSYSVHRIGRFLRGHSPTPEERQFEVYVEFNRTHMEDTSQVFLNVATVLCSVVMLLTLNWEVAKKAPHIGNVSLADVGGAWFHTSWGWILLMGYLSGLPYCIYIWGTYVLEYENFNCAACRDCKHRKATKTKLRILTVFSVTWVWALAGGFNRTRERCLGCETCIADCHGISSAFRSVSDDFCI